MKKILIIEREYGAPGSEVAEKVAKRLGWKLYDQALTEEIARLAKVSPEVCEEARSQRVDPWFQKLARVFWHGSHERGVNFADSDMLDSDRLMCLTKKVIEEAVAPGNCVIVGRGAPYFLRDRTDTYCVFLYASREEKFHHVLKRIKDETEAIKLVDTVDDDRKEFVKHYFGPDWCWPHRSLYDAMLNTAIGEDATADVILYLLENAAKHKGVPKKP